MKRPAGRCPGLRIGVLIVLAVDGVLSAMAGALLLPAYIGSVPCPLSAPISGLVNAALVWAARHWTESIRVAALPLWTWLLTVVAMSFGGPGDDRIFAGRGVLAYGALLLITLGSVPPAWVLWRTAAGYRHRRPGPRRREGSAGLR
ncbi:hypothetical protein [Mycobacterium sp. SM1]|uniref:hypothetical protein n=1 Tax=Mycobacterium sp. SM1 TaxID=2816243 RepID=UPI001F18F9B4|nr:hypothetical protein [Mycobacterium sp. SM1]